MLPVTSLSGSSFNLLCPWGRVNIDTRSRGFHRVGMREGCWGTLFSSISSFPSVGQNLRQLLGALHRWRACLYDQHWVTRKPKYRVSVGPMVLRGPSNGPFPGLVVLPGLWLFPSSCKFPHLASCKQMHSFPGGPIPRTPCYFTHACWFSLTYAFRMFGLMVEHSGVVLYLNMHMR